MTANALQLCEGRAIELLHSNNLMKMNKEINDEGLQSTPAFAKLPVMGSTVELSRVWAMPSIWTFTVKPIAGLINKYHRGTWADPFAGENSPAEITNDIEGRGAKHQMDALEFLKSLPDNSLDGCFFDPPYSTEQCLRRYTPKQKGTAGRAEYWAKCKDEIKRIVKVGGTVISFCWDSTGIGKKRGFEIIEIMLVCHGACHNDTIITVEIKRW